MTAENPYRYEGTAESLAKPQEPARAVRRLTATTMFFAGAFAALATALLVPFLSDTDLITITELISYSLVLTLVVLFSIGIFIGIFVSKKNPLIAQIGFWIAAAPLALFFTTKLFDQSSWASVIQQAAEYLLIGYGFQLLAASAALGLITRKSQRS